MNETWFDRVDLTFGDSVLDAGEFLNVCEDLDSAFVSVYQKSMLFSEILLDTERAQQARMIYFESAAEIGGVEINDLDELQDELWAGYHPVVILFSRLRLYGQMGRFHYDDAANAAESDSLKHELDVARTIFDLLPNNWMRNEAQDEKEPLREVLLAAEGRFRLDTGEQLEVDQLISLSGLNPRTVKNAISKGGDAGISVGKDGLISNAETRRWLEGRKGFQWTVNVRPDSQGEKSSSGDTSNLMEQVEFIPVANDGTEFRPSTRRDQGYQVGAKGSEEYIESYTDALATLQKMNVPRWRRPNENGNWGIVTCASWRRVSVAELNSDVGVSPP